MGTILDNGFEQIYLMMNALNREVAEVFDTYVYTLGITQGAFSYSTAVGLFKSVIGVIMVLGTNWLAKKFGESGIY
ncbi:putative multiple-sugar transport system permease YteP [compost metagenome]